MVIIQSFGPPSILPAVQPLMLSTPARRPLSFRTFGSILFNNYIQRDGSDLVLLLVA